MHTVSSFVAALAQHTVPGRAAAWDPVGLQIGDGSAPVSRVAVCHEVTEKVVAAIATDPPDLVVAYHPLLFRPTSRLVAGTDPAGRAWRLASLGVALVVTHTDFDACSGGTADSLAAELGLEDVTPFAPVAGADSIKVIAFVPPDAADRVTAALAAAGAGRVGNYSNCSFRTAGEGRFMPEAGSDPVVGTPGDLTVAPEVRVEMVAPRSREESVVAALVTAHPYEEPAFEVIDSRSNQALIGRIGTWKGTIAELGGHVGAKLGRSGLRLAGLPGAMVRRVAVVPGSGASFLGVARRAGADAIVTGDVDHHRAVAAVDAGLAVIDPGHAATERPGMKRLVALVAGLDVQVTDLTGDGSGPWVDLLDT